MNNIYEYCLVNKEYINDLNVNEKQLLLVYMYCDLNINIKECAKFFNCEENYVYEYLNDNQYVISNKERYRYHNRRWYNNNKEIKLKSNTEWFISNHEKQLGYIKKYKSKPEIKIKSAEYMRLKKASDPLYRLHSNMGSKICNILKNRWNVSKSNIEWEKMIGYSLNDLKNHLESQFDKDMNWENYGTYWEIDHIVPISVFSITEEAFYKLWSLKNLRPLYWETNRKKQNFIGLEWKNSELAEEFTPFIQPEFLV